MEKEKNNFDKEELIREIHKLRKEKNAVLLAHYYQEAEIQEIADFVGDSLDLSRKARSTEADIIVFAGVHFMAETAKILNPLKKVLIPDMNAGCSLAESCPADLLQELKNKNPNHIIVSYINCSAEVKAISDIICTSSNAEKIINQIPVEQKIIFTPDKNLGKYLIKKTGREMLLWDGSCIVHEHFNEKKLLGLLYEHPDAKVIAHPECEESYLMYANHIGSTSSLLKYVIENPAHKFIVATEPGIIYQMKKSCPDKIFIEAPTEEGCSCNICPHMKLNTLEKIYLCLKNGYPEIVMSEQLRLASLKPIERMLEMS